LWRRALSWSVLVPTLALLAVYSLAYLQFAGQLVAFPFDLDQGEGYDAWSAWLINLGQLPYSDNAAFPYYSSNYPPLWSYLVSIPMAWLGPGLASARAVSTLAALLTAGVLGFTARRAAGNLAGVLAAGFFLASPYVFHTTPLARVNSTALLAAVVGLSLFERPTPKHVLLGSLALVVALFTKPTVLDAVAAGLIALLLRNWRLGLLAGGTVLGLGLLGLGALLLATHGTFWLNVVAGNANPFDLGQLKTYITNFSLLHCVLLVLAGAECVRLLRARTWSVPGSAAAEHRAVAPRPWCGAHDPGTLAVARGPQRGSAMATRSRAAERHARTSTEHRRPSGGRRPGIAAAARSRTDTGGRPELRGRRRPAAGRQCHSFAQPVSGWLVGSDARGERPACASIRYRGARRGALPRADSHRDRPVLFSGPRGAHQQRDLSPVSTGVRLSNPPALPLYALTPIALRASVVIPCFNERGTVNELIDRVLAVPIEKQIIVVDDCSTDGTRELLVRRAEERGDITLKLRSRNGGKGSAVQEGLKLAEGDVVIIQDADLEYDPGDYPLLLRPIQTGRAKVVFGSRFLGEHRAMYFWHSVGNRSLTLLCNVLFNTTLTDMETCYKVFTIDIARRLKLREPGWGFDPEITARILKMGHRIYEVPISYAGREFDEGKKISWHDGFVVLLTLLRYRLLP
jgi:hypothetical protein